jgi:hypothetical protein
MTGISSDEAIDLVGLLQLPREEPTLRIVVVADLDLASASALAEYALHDHSIAGGNVDLLLACDPFVETRTWDRTSRGAPPIAHRN